MSTHREKIIPEICRKAGGDRTALREILREVQKRCGCVSAHAAHTIARELKLAPVEVAGVSSFYSFFSQKKQGTIVIRLCDDLIDEFAGGRRVARAFEEASGIRFGHTTCNGLLSLQKTQCIGMSDQAPAALINDTVATCLSEDSARRIVQELRMHRDPARLVTDLGDGNNAHPLLRAMVRNNIRKEGPVIFALFSAERGCAGPSLCPLRR